jgi:peptidoglycan-associated lipoprotein
MNRFMRVSLTVLTVPVAAALLLGCPKTVEKTEPTPPPKVRESVMTTRPTTPGAGTEATSPAGTGGGAAQQTEEQRMAQLLASRGEDIPIKEGATIEFTEPAPEDKGVLRTIYFDYDKALIKPEFQKALEGISQWMVQHPQKQVLIEGHCDERGTDEYNLALGERRALSVRRYLVGLGIAAERLHTISYGEEKPADPGHDETAWVKNRRAEFKVSAQ